VVLSLDDDDDDDDEDEDEDDDVDKIIVGTAVVACGWSVRSASEGLASPMAHGLTQVPGLAEGGKGVEGGSWGASMAPKSGQRPTRVGRGGGVGSSLPVHCRL
jgi:hypothetical protein